jgi:hypothetical protein
VPIAQRQLVAGQTGQSPISLVGHERPVGIAEQFS